MHMATQSDTQQDARRKSRKVGMVSIAILAVLFVLLFVGLNIYIWGVLVIGVWLAANYLLRRIKKQALEAEA